jgi:methionyl aminopeptidase
MIHCKTNEEIELMRLSSLLVSKTLTEVASRIRPGITTLDLDTLAEQFIRDHGATPSFKGYGSPAYPFATCISVNDAVVHGFPSKIPLREGDIVSVDVGAYLNGFHGDSAYTFAIGVISSELQQLLIVTKESLYRGIAKAVHGNRVGDISHAIQHHTESLHGYGVVRDLVGHGVGRNLHEEPQVPNFGKRGAGPKITEGMTLAIEPMINLGGRKIYHDKDGWTIRTSDNKPSAHFEHTVCVRRIKADVLSSFTDIEAAEKSNPDLWSEYPTGAGGNQMGG